MEATGIQHYACLITVILRETDGFLQSIQQVKGDKITCLKKLSTGKGRVPVISCDGF